MAGKKLDELQAFFGAEGATFERELPAEHGGPGYDPAWGPIGNDVTEQVRELLHYAAKLLHDLQDREKRIGALESELRATVAAGNAAAEPAYRRIAELEAENAGLKSAIDTQAAIIAQHENAEGDAVSRARQDVREHMWRLETDRDNKVMELRAENAMLRRKVAGVESVIDGTKAVRTEHIERMLRLAEDPE